MLNELLSLEISRRGRSDTDCGIFALFPVEDVIYPPCNLILTGSRKVQSCCLRLTNNSLTVDD